VQAVHGLPVSERVMGMVQLVVSELVTNARKYAPGPWSAPVSSSGGTSQRSAPRRQPEFLTGITEWVETLL
jgi:hypothetical protein